MESGRRLGEIRREPAGREGHPPGSRRRSADAPGAGERPVLRVRAPAIRRRDERFTDLASRGRGLGARLRDPELRPAILASLVLLVVGVVGSREILRGGMAEFGEFAGFVESPMTLLREFVSTSQASGVGADGVPPTAFGLLGAAGGAVLGKMALLRTVLSIGLFPVAGWATWSLARRLGFSPVPPSSPSWHWWRFRCPTTRWPTDPGPGCWSGRCPRSCCSAARRRWTIRSKTAASTARPRSRRRHHVGLGLVLWLVTAFVPFAFVPARGGARAPPRRVGAWLGERTAVRELIVVGSGAVLIAAVSCTCPGCSAWCSMASPGHPSEAPASVVT